MFGRKEKSVGQKINEARYNPENPDYRAVNVSDKLMELHEKFCEARGLDPESTGLSFP